MKDLIEDSLRYSTQCLYEELIPIAPYKSLEGWLLEGSLNREMAEEIANRLHYPTGKFVVYENQISYISDFGGGNCDRKDDTMLRLITSTYENIRNPQIDDLITNCDIRGLKYDLCNCISTEELFELFLRRSGGAAFKITLPNLKRNKADVGIFEFETGDFSFSRWIRFGDSETINSLAAKHNITIERRII